LKPSVFKKRQHKYNDQRTMVDGKAFPSKLEAAVYAFLKLEEKQGRITKLECQPTVFLTDAEISYKPDFKFEREGQVVFGEAKGTEGDRFRLIKKLWKWYGPAPLEIYKGTAKRIALAKTIIPMGGPHK